MNQLLSPREIGERIQRKRVQAGMEVRDLAAALGVSEFSVGKLERGDLDPLPGDWILIAARALRVDYRSLISTSLDGEEEATRKVYRSLANPSPQDEYDLRRFFAFATEEQDLRRGVERTLPALPDGYRTRVGQNFKQHGLDTARAERKRLRLGLRPIANPFELLREQGVVFFRQRLRDSALSGITAMHPRAGVCVLVNYDDDLYRQFFSAAHEYAHVLLDRERINSEGCIVSYRGKHDLIEVRANAFAAALLLPREALASRGAPRNEAEARQQLVQVAKEYHVNTQVALIAMTEAGVLSRALSEALDGSRPRIPGALKEDPDLPPHLTDRQRDRRQHAIEHGLDMRFLELVRSALVQNAITLGRAAEALDVPMSQVRTFLRDLGAPL